MTFPAIRAVVAPVTLIMMASCSPGTQLDIPDDVVTTSAGVKRIDTMVWEDRTKNRREVMVTIEIPPGRDHVVLEPAGGDSAVAADGTDGLKILEVNSVAVLVPSKLRHIEVRPGNEDALKTVLLVELARCDSLVFFVRDSVAGRPLVRHMLGQTHDFPSCCLTVGRAEPE